MKRGFRRSSASGFTLAEVILGGVVLAIAAAAILGAYVGQVTLNEHARNLSLAVNDATRVVEQMRQQTSTCTTPNVSHTLANAGATSWDNWLEAFGGGKSIRPDPANNERIVVTCQTQGGALDADCVGPNPILVSVAVCWRHRGRIIGECQANGVALLENEGLTYSATDTAAIDSPAMLTTLITCRG